MVSRLIRSSIRYASKFNYLQKTACGLRLFSKQEMYPQEYAQTQVDEATQKFREFIKKSEEIDQKQKVKQDFFQDIQQYLEQSEQQKQEKEKQDQKYQIEQQKRKKRFQDLYAHTKIGEIIIRGKQVQDVQYIFEDFLFQCKKLQQNQQDPLGTQFIIEFFKDIWDLKISQHVDKIITYPKLIKLVFEKPLIEVTEVKNFKRITSDKEGSIHPIFDSSLGDFGYELLLNNFGIEGGNVLHLKKIVDHMAAYQYVPSKSVLASMIEICLQGKWPKTLKAFLIYIIPFYEQFDMTQMREALLFFTRCKGFEQHAVDLLRILVDNKQEINYFLLDPIISWNVKYNNIDECTELMKQVKQLIPRILYSKKIQEQKELINIKWAELVYQYLKKLFESNQIDTAKQLYFSELMTKQEVIKDGKVYDFGFQILEQSSNLQEIEKLWEYVVNNKSLAPNKKIMLRVLRLILNQPIECLKLAQSVQKKMVEQQMLTDLSLNFLFKIYVNHLQWIKLQELLKIVSQSQIKLSPENLLFLKKLSLKCNEPIIQDYFNTFVKTMQGAEV